MSVTSTRSAVPAEAACRGRRTRTWTSTATNSSTAALSASRITGCACFVGAAVRLRDQHEHRLERREVDERLHLDVLEDVGVVLADARDEADRDVARVERRELARRRASRR